MKKQTWIDPTDIAVELLSRSDVLEGAARRLVAGFRSVVLWLGDAADTPTTGDPPIVAPSRSGSWSGVVFVHRNRATSWLLLRSDDVGRDGEPVEVATHPVDEIGLDRDPIFDTMNGPHS